MLARPTRRPGPRERAPGWITLALLAWAALAPVGCGSPGEAPASESVATTSQAIYGGVEDGDAQANSAVVALTVGTSAQDFVLCTGTLIAPNVVLTAHHCVGSNLAATVTCDTTGTSTSGTQIGADVNPAIIHVYVGAQPDLMSGTPDANGAAIFDTQGSTLCNSDVAVVLLDRSIGSITPLAVRLSSTTRPGESVRAVGFGQNDQNAPVGTRFRRDGLAILAIGAEVSPSGTSLGSNELELGTSTCEGDSGGPAISEETGAIVGVVSRGGACTDDFGHIYTVTSGFSELITTAMAAAGEVPLEEVIGADASAPARDSGATTAPGATGGGAVSPPSPSSDAGDPHGTPFQGAEEAYPQESTCAVARRAGGGSDSGGALFAFAALALLGVRRRRSRP